MPSFWGGLTQGLQPLMQDRFRQAAEDRTFNRESQLFHERAKMAAKKEADDRAYAAQAEADRRQFEAQMELMRQQGRMKLLKEEMQGRKEIAHTRAGGKGGGTKGGVDPQAAIDFSIMVDEQLASGNPLFLASMPKGPKEIYYQGLMLRRQQGEIPGKPGGAPSVQKGESAIAKVELEDRLRWLAEHYPRADMYQVVNLINQRGPGILDEIEAALKEDAAKQPK